MLRLFITACFMLQGLSISFAQDGIFHSMKSDFFDDEREIEVLLPRNWNYASEQVHWPVIYLLDGQHDFFADPVKNNIKTLQRVKEIPDAVVVIIYQEDRVLDSNLPADDRVLPLHSFITEELDPFIQENYRSNSCRVIISHSYTASFAFRSFYWAPDFYDALILHSPLNQIEKSTSLLLSQSNIDLSKIYMSVGGSGHSKDRWHLEAHTKNQEKHPEFYQQIHYAQIESATHNALPVVQTGAFLTAFFYDFSVRTDNIAKVDMNYQLVEDPEGIEAELSKIEKACEFGDDVLLMTISEINGIASRYWASEFTAHVEAIYEYGQALYPEYFDFHLYLAQLKAERGLKDEAIAHLREAKRLTQLHEMGTEAYEYIMADIEIYLEELTKP
ncbi:MAG: alpha/beta hydrolase-fold protein [Flavobacteriaceae bacterium]|nr:alpha/beta hydrolase-fold protein [Flavobacteriaceae bacterium]